MGCTRSKLNKDICLKDETTEMHLDFIKKKGLDAYYAIMGIESDKSHNSFDDNSSKLILDCSILKQRTKQTWRLKTRDCPLENISK